MISPVTAYFLLPGLQILALWVPPFRGRALIFISAILASAVVLHSDRVSDDPQITYALGMAWASYLATIDRLLFTTPELSFWRVGDKAGEALHYGFGLKKLRWSMGQLFNPRGIHWNYMTKGITCTEGKPEFLSRRAYVSRNTILFFKLCLGYDILHTYLVSQHREGPANGGYVPLGDRSFAWRFATTAAAAYVIFCGVQLNYIITSVAFVGLGLSQPEDWPPLFGDVGEAFTVRRVWGRFWHKLIRRTLSAYSKFIVRTLMITNDTIGAVCHMFIVFLISGVFHALPLRVMLGDEHRLPLGTVFFFSSQAAAVWIEESVILVYRRATGGNTQIRSWHRWAGFAWVSAWLYWSLPFFLDDMFASGMMDASTIPFSVARAVAGIFGWPLRG